MKIFYFFIFTCLFFEKSYALKTILIEGNDYCGKTTTCEGLQKEFTKEFRDTENKVQINHRFISGDETLIKSSRKAWDSLPVKLPTSFRDENFFKDFNTIMTECFGQDLEKYKDNPWDKNIPLTILQDRSFLTQSWMNSYFTENLDLKTERIMNNYVPFQYNVFLYCSANARKDRAKQRDPWKKPDAIDQLFVHYAEDLQDFDNFCLGEIDKRQDERWLVHNNSNKTLEDSLTVIEKFIE
jgi:thymidylate kinase